jgi:hypothetical protein
MSALIAPVHAPNNAPKIAAGSGIALALPSNT